MAPEQPERKTTQSKQEVKPRQSLVIEGELTDDELKQVTGGVIQKIGTGGPTRRRTRSGSQPPA